MHYIPTTAFNTKANGMMERANISVKTSEKARWKHWMTQLLIILLGLWMRPDNDRTSAFSRVTGEQPLVPHILQASFNNQPSNFTELPHELKLNRLKEIESQIPEEIKSCPYVWIRIDRVKRPLEAPYQGPYKVLQRHEAANQLLVKGKVVIISLDRLKPARLPEYYECKE